MAVLPPPHLVPAPPPWVEERRLPFEVEPYPGRACRRCGGQDRALGVEVALGREVIEELIVVLDALRAEAVAAHEAREASDRECLDLLSLLSAFHEQAARFEGVVDRARKALGRARREHGESQQRIQQLERYIAALEERTRAVAQASGPRPRIRSSVR